MAMITAQTTQPDDTSTAAAYDDVPYASHPFPQTNPLSLQGVAKLFGLTAPIPDKARILEIGCASGCNILAIAALYPKSQCVGIDYSAKQIEQGKKDLKELGISNLELKHMSVSDITADFGLFDYIICHGVMSWVPRDVQDKILDVCKANLSKDGIAYISYNTLPGWNSIRSMRDMMLYHTERFSDPATKAQQARQILKFVSEGMRAKNNPMSAMLDRENTLLGKHPDYYLLHDHMEDNNFPFYFHEFMERAGQRGLQYVADVDLEKMFTGNLPTATAEILATSNDIVRTEQYMDFIYDRRFRSTLLCHNDRILNRNIDHTILLQGFLTSRFTYPADFKDHDISSNQSLPFPTPGGMTLNSSDPVVLAMLQIFMELQPQPIRIADLAERVQEKLRKAKSPLPQGDKTALENVLCTHALRNIFLGAMHFYLQDMPFIATVSEKPMLSALARNQAGRQGWITTQRQEAITLTIFDKVFIPHVDGTHSVKELEGILLPYFKSKALVMNDNNAPVTDIAVIKAKIPDIVKFTLQRFAELGLLVK